MISKYMCPEAILNPDNAHPIDVLHTNHVYYVQHGTVNLFLSDKNENPEKKMARFPVATVCSGSIFCGFDYPHDEAEFFAIGTLDAVVECYQMDKIVSLWKTEVSIFDDLFSRWFETVSSSVLKISEKNKIIVDDMPGYSDSTAIDVRSGSSLSSRMLCWAYCNDNNLQQPFLSKGMCVPDTYFPLINSLCVTAVNDITVTLASTLQLIDRNILQYSIQHFFLLVFTELVLQWKRNETYTIAQMYKTELMEEKRYASLIESGKRIFDNEKKENSILNAALSSENNIITAIIRTCKVSHIDIKPLAGKQYDESVSVIYELSRDNNIRVRDIMLTGTWWNADNGNIVAFYKKTDDEVIPVSLIVYHGCRYRMILPDGNATVVDDALAEKIMPSAYMFYRPFPDEKIPLKKMIQFALTGLSSVVARCGIFGVICACVGLLIPEITRIFTDTIIPEAAVNRMFQLSMLVVASAIASGFFEFVKGLALTRLETKSDWVLQAAVMDRVMKMPVGFFKDYTSGDLTERTLAISSIRSILSGTVLSSLMSFAFSIVYLVQIFIYSRPLAFRGLIFCLIPAAVSCVVNIKCYKKNKSIAELKGKISGKLLEFIRGAPKLVTTSSEKRAFCEWSDSFNKQSEISFSSGKIVNFQTVFSSCFSIIVTIFFYGFFIAEIKKGNGTISTGTFLAFMAAYSSFQYSLTSVISALSQSVMIMPLYERAKPILDTQPEILESKPSILKLNGTIEVNHVNFRYSEDGPLILKDVSIQVHPGEFIALVGGSGSGKSTLLRLLLGFEKAESGSIYFDNQDIESLDISSVRRRMGVVLQNGSLMQGSVYTNIAGNTSLSIDEAWDAAARCGLDEDIKQMPMGMHTMVSMGGGGLSGGQRQRLIIARAIAHRPDVLFFDEATSALDNKTQRIVSESLEKMNVTRIVIAHRLSTIINADRIYVLQNGKVVETGNYQSLMAEKKFFYDLASRQNI